MPHSEQPWLDSAVETGSNARSHEIDQQIKTKLVCLSQPGSIYLVDDYAGQPVHYLKATDFHTGYDLFWLDTKDRCLCPCCAYVAASEHFEDPETTPIFPLVSAQPSYATDDLFCDECNQLVTKA